jgi:hypothetical protein
MLLASYGYASLPTPRGNTRDTHMKKTQKWTKEEDEIIAQWVQTKGQYSWSELNLPGKTPVQISERWSKVLDPSLMRGNWTPDEDDQIRQWVLTHGTKTWTELAASLPGRIAKQCRERWMNHLDQNVRQIPFTQEEDRLLIQLHEQYGNKWERIAAMMPGRSANQCKNRWNSCLSKRINPEFVPPTRGRPRKNQPAGQPKPPPILPPSLNSSFDLYTNLFSFDSFFKDLDVPPTRGQSRENQPAGEPELPLPLSQLIPPPSLHSSSDSSIPEWTDENSFSFDLPIPKWTDGNSFSDQFDQSKDSDNPFQDFDFFQGL